MSEIPTYPPGSPAAEVLALLSENFSWRVMPESEVGAQTRQRYVALQEIGRRIGIPDSVIQAIDEQHSKTADAWLAFIRLPETRP
ncbi:hypothetical protein [Kribbella deserti]|uniref:XRE family transcriptional regulator n=1 Tax=Kribbella deserti TaxID=1926257 RepID=A0ABV6QNR3_9ACTN